jgi:hypothetical protein
MREVMNSGHAAMLAARGRLDYVISALARREIASSRLTGSAILAVFLADRPR